MKNVCLVDLVLFDYGGVLAEEGFREGLKAIARKNGLDPDSFFGKAAELVHASGYVTGRCTEEDYWNILRAETGIEGSDSNLRHEILERFVLRGWMMTIVKRLKEAGVDVAILSDQTNWLTELDRRDAFFQWFQHVFNSFLEGKSKRDPTLFDDVARRLQVEPSRILFVDDTAGHIERARSRGFQAVQYRDRQEFLTDLGVFCPALMPAGPLAQ